jgi:hypothetical protein
VVFQLLVVLMFGSAPAGMGYYASRGDCLAAAAAYRQAECKEVDGNAPIHGTCWGCMHGCTAAANLRICGTDPGPKDDE